MYIITKRRLRNEGYITVIDPDDTETDPKHIEKTLKKEYNAIIRNNIGLLAIVYLFFFIFPTTMIDEPRARTIKSAPIREGHTIVGDAQKYEGVNWFEKLVANRKRYIKRFGYEAYMKRFGEQMAAIEPAIREYELKKETLKTERENIEKEKERILYGNEGYKDTGVINAQSKREN